MRQKGRVSGRLAILTIGLALVCSHTVVPLRAEKSYHHSFVKVRLNREFPGIVHKSRYIPQIEVNEVSELQGVVIDPQGHVLCYVGNYWPELTMPGVHVGIQLEDASGRRFAGRMVGVDERVSLMVVECDELKGRGLKLAPRLEKGRLQFISLSGRTWSATTPSLVEVSRTRLNPIREVQVAPRIKGASCVNEGGFILNQDNNLAGVVTRAVSHPFSRSLQVWQAVPSEVVGASVRQVVASRGNVKAGWLGIMYEPGRVPVAIQQVVPGSPADRAGLAVNDVIVALDEIPLEGQPDLSQLIRWKGSGSRLDVLIRRGEGMRHVTAVLSERQDRPPVVAYRLEVPSVWTREPEGEFRISRTVLPPHLRLGLAVNALTSQLARYFEVPAATGLLVTYVREKSPAQQIGIRAGDVLMRVNDREVASPSDFQRSLEAVSGGAIVVQFVRRGRVMTRRVVLP